MTEPHKRKRHPKYQTAYRVKNWHKYDKALRNRMRELGRPLSYPVS